mgnify:FL=1
MHRLIEDYLKLMAKRIRNKQARRDATLEIQNHLLDQVDELVEQGKNYEDSVAIVIKNATDPKVLGEKLNLAHKPMLLRYPLTLFASSSVAMTIIALIVASHVAIDKVKEINANSIMEEKVYRDFFLDLKDLEKKNLYKVSRKKNIASFLSKHLDLYEQKNEKFNVRSFCKKHQACYGF